MGHIENFEAQVAVIEKRIPEIPEDQTDPDGTNTRKRMIAQAEGIRMGIAKDLAALTVTQSPAKDIELEAQRLEALAAQKQAEAATQKLIADIDKASPEELREAATKIREAVVPVEPVHVEPSYDLVEIESAEPKKLSLMDKLFGPIS